MEDAIRSKKRALHHAVHRNAARTADYQLIQRREEE